MATKKECDRCGDQWTPKTGYATHDNEMALVTFKIPQKPDTYLTTRTQPVNREFEFCQNCARVVYELARTQPAKSDDA